MRASLAASTPLATAFIWSLALMVRPSPLETAPALLVSVGLILSSAVATIGLIVTGGRWARLLGLGALTGGAVVAVLRPVDILWAIGLTATAISVLALFSRGLDQTIRKLPSAGGPPPRVVFVPLLTLIAPVIIGLSGNEAEPWAMLTVGLTGPVAAFVYSRVIPGGLLAVRVLWPALALGQFAQLGPVCGSITAGMGIVVAVLAWHPSVKASYHPPTETGTTYPIPPELAPTEVLDAAEIDETGRRR